MSNSEKPSALSLLSKPTVFRVFRPNEDKRTVRKLLRKAGIKVGGSKPWDIQVHNDDFYRRALADGSLGLGESYVEGWWDVPSLDEFFNVILKAQLEKEVRPLFMFGQVIKAKTFNLQDKIRSQKVAEIHYDLGNDFYETMLDPWMQYTCAYWKHARDLNQAQEHKLDLVCRKINLQKGDKVLELGCGWGGFARFAATNYGAQVTAYNISKEQVAYAREKSKGLPVEYRLQDYREASGTYDKVVSIGMGEHIGPKNYHHFFKLVSECLKPGGLLLFHTIGNNKTSVVTEPWLDKYIFPGSLLPSATQISQAAEGLLIMEDWHNFGADYDKTLMAWYENFLKNWEAAQKPHNEFFRMWKYYLLMCAGSFRARKNQLWQVVFSKGGISGGYLSQR